MNPIDWIIVAAIVLIVGAASAYIIKAKKSGKKCIGCPDSSSCHSQKSDSCGGNCGSCGGGCSMGREN